MAPQLMKSRKFLPLGIILGAIAISGMLLLPNLTRAFDWVMLELISFEGGGGGFPMGDGPSPTPEPSATGGCVAPYHVLSNDGRCVWSCASGTEPDPTGGNECVCAPGFVEVGTDVLGRRICGVATSLFVISPNGDEMIGASSTYQVSWGSNNIPSTDLVELSYFPNGTDPLITRTIIANTPNDGTHSWNITSSTPEGTYRIRVARGSVSDTSNQGFFIRPFSASCPAPYNIVTFDNRCVNTCAPGTTPDNPTRECICQTGLVETSADVFGRRICTAPAVAPTLTVVSPNGGETFLIGTSAHPILWSSTNLSSTAFVELSYFSTSGAVENPNAIREIIATATPNDGSFLWTIPSSIFPGPYKVIVRYGGFQDTSNSSFTIQSP